MQQSPMSMSMMDLRPTISDEKAPSRQKRMATGRENIMSNYGLFSDEYSLAVNATLVSAEGAQHGNQQKLPSVDIVPRRGAHDESGGTGSTIS